MGHGVEVGDSDEPGKKSRGPIALKTKEEKLKWEGKALQETKYGWVHRDGEKTVEIRPLSWKILVVEINGGNAFQKNICFEDSCQKNPGKVSNLELKSPYDKTPIKIDTGDYTIPNIMTRLENVGITKKSMGRLVDPDTMTSLEVGGVFRLTQKKLTEKQQGDEVHKSERKFLIMVESEYSRMTTQNPIQVTYRVLEPKKFEVPHMVRGYRLIREGVSLDDSKELLKETITLSDESTKMINFLLQPGVEDRIAAIRDRLERDEQLRKRAQG